MRLTTEREKCVDKGKISIDEEQDGADCSGVTPDMGDLQQ